MLADGQLQDQLQSVLNDAACLVFSAKRSERIDYKLAVLVYKCLYGLAPAYLADKLHHPAESEF